MLIDSVAIEEHIARGPWRQLEAAALKVVDMAERAGGRQMSPVLGGGTRLMLALRHRLSDDIDLFIRDPQWIAYITPRLNDEVGALAQSYDEASDFLKLRHPAGEIDFIVRMSLLGEPPQRSELCAFMLEPVAEVLAKKLFYRGWALTPRDLYDWWAICDRAPDEIDAAPFGALLRNRSAVIEQSLLALSNSAGAAERWEAIRAASKPSIQDAAAAMRLQLLRYLRESAAPGEVARER
jgi:hypothetical protein